MTPDDYIRTARVPHRLKPQTFGPWRIERVSVEQLRASIAIHTWPVGFPDYTLLTRVSYRTLHQKGEWSDLVMEDSRDELKKHLPIWLKGEGHVLVTGLGLGCVVRGLLASPKVEHITVVEIDKSILRIVGHEFQTNRRVTLVHGDALTVQLGVRFDCAWHDLWSDGEEHLQLLHGKLFARFRHCKFQGAWQFPRMFKRLMRYTVPLIG